MTPKSKSKSKSRDLFPGALELMILQTLVWKSLHGYALVQYLKQRSKNQLQVEEGSVYPALQRLLKEEMVVTYLQDSPNNRRVRTYFITVRGVKHLELERARFDRMVKGMSLVLTPDPEPAN